jgi:hypothetical protein
MPRQQTPKSVHAGESGVGRRGTGVSVALNAMLWSTLSESPHVPALGMHTAACNTPGSVIGNPATGENMSMMD